jgi:DNA-directed RNA polymerase subunit E'/Rpb7
MLIIHNKKTLLPIIAGLLAVAFLLTSFASYFVSRTSLRSEISDNELPLTGDNIYSEIQRDLLRPIFISSFMAQDTFLRNWLLSGEQDQGEISQYLKEIQHRYQTFTSFLVSEKTRNYYHGDGILKQVRADEERDRWYFRVRDMQPDYEINIDPDQANRDALTIFINHRVFDYQGRLIGVTGVGLSVNAVKEIIELYQQKYKRTIYFYDKTRLIMPVQAGAQAQAAGLVPMMSVAELLEKLPEQGESSFSGERHGHIVHTNIRYIKEFGWYLVVEQSEQHIVRAIFTTLVFNLLLCMVVTGTVVFLVKISVDAYTRRIDTLRGIVPICSYCKEIRDDKGYWNQVEAYISKYTEAQFSHSICPKCLKKHFPEIDLEEELDKPRRR